MEICKKEKCTGCYACVNSCRHACITMQEDEFGILYPCIDETKCKQCNACVRSCPVNNIVSKSEPQICYAVINKDKQEISNCATSGMGFLIAVYTITKRNGYVFATLYDDSLIPRFAEITNVDKLEYIKGSKYVQSIVGDNTMHRIRELLNKGQYVTFIGTPCQVSGLKQYLTKEYPNLLTVDLLCHGVCPTRYFIEEINYLKSKYKIKNISDVRFRGNDGYNYVLSLWNGERKEYSCHSGAQPYFAGFMYGTTLRPNCFQCDYAKTERIGDITIGDFIGLGKSIPFEYEKENVSFVSVNTSKGADMISLLKADCRQLAFYERTYKERCAYPYSLLKPAELHHSVALFSRYCPKYGYVRSVRKALRKELFWPVLKLHLSWLKPIYHMMRRLVVGRRSCP